jgi:hypothetical protein
MPLVKYPLSRPKVGEENGDPEGEDIAILEVAWGTVSFPEVDDAIVAILTFFLEGHTGGVAAGDASLLRLDTINNAGCSGWVSI